ncbi:thiamine phosphate synthase [Tropicimonas isoalkanivorans]|uniref:Thiamine-phosphate synthase n=1 Tax=Tropicimonas isoalkanivorans TaxID=441112 RepID=A0A1I1FTF8_9RHOB|nr:thiamine phosphate synthase [Tropicimonas isoalkanivorans]SFC02614.1 thiamine-phosphate pyrophosphorylase [Tropicimonas isoalkanivorans]
MRTPLDLSAYLVLDPDLCANVGMVETARAAMASGIRTIQLRHKTASTSERVKIGRALRAAMEGTGALLVVNDDVEAAVACGADGLHVGQGDRPAHEARAAIGPDMVLGLSVETEAHARALDPKTVDYAGVGPVFGTPTKPDHARPVGMDGLARIVALCPVPSVAIGGLTAAHAQGVIAAGAAGLAVVSAICGQPDPEAAARDLVEAVKGART